MLRFIAGRAGTGKTYTVLRDAVAAAPSHKMTYIIVPEQSTLSYEKQLIEYNAEARRLGVEVLSFTRMVEKVMLETGGLAGNYIDSMGKTALIYRAIRDCSDSLRLFGKYRNDPRFALRIAETVAELKINAVSPESLSAAAENEGLSGTLRDKLRDTALIVSEYERLIRGGFFDPADKLTALCEILDAFDFFKDCAVYFDGFTGFSVQEEAVIERIIGQSADCVVSLSAPSPEAEGDVFKPVVATAERFRGFASGRGVAVGETTLLTDDHKFRSPTMKLLESMLYSAERGISGGEDLTFYSAADPYDEMRYVASEIRRLVREKRYRYRDFAVVAGDLEGVRGAAETEFEKYGIPFFIDSRSDVRFKPLMRLVSFAFRAALRGMYYEDMADLAKTGLAGVDAEHSALLENYINLWRVSGKKWESDFTLNPRGFTDAVKESDAAALAEINAARKSLAEPLFEFKNKISGELTADGFAAAVFAYLEGAGAAETIRAEHAAAAAAGEEYDGGRMWELLMDVLDRVSSAMGGEKMTAENYSELLRLLFENADVGVIPPHADEVIIGSEGRVRVEHIKYCFIVGATDENFPHPFGAKGVFTNADKEDLLKLDLPLMHSEDLRRCELMLSVYNALTIPSEGLSVSYSAAENTLTSAAPSRVILDLKDKFNDCRDLDARKLRIEDICSAPAAALEVCAGFCGSPETPEQAAVCDAVRRVPELAEKLERFRELRENAARPLEPDAAAALAAKTDFLSSSKTEQYAGCPYSFFCKYGLSVYGAPKAELDARNIGTFVHHVLERTVKAMSEGGLPDGVEAYAKRVAEEYVEACLGGAENLPASFLRSIDKTTELIVELVGYIKSELDASGYVPDGFELKIGSGGVAPWSVAGADGEMRFEGKIDRVDICVRDGKTFLRVVDYKTNKDKKVVSLEKIYNGEDIQMLIYLIAIWLNGADRYGAGLKPAGVYYFPANRVLIDADKNDFENKYASARALSGLALEDSPYDGRHKPAFYTMDELGLLKKHIEKLMRQMRARLAEGSVPKLPSNDKKCEYCDYAAICGVDREAVETRARAAVRGAAVFDRLREEYGDER
ncbi:MAG: PD-(D/E)XK nuclease family protein [Clostridia bacterium]|nr:PD-(D/E)XK nuclease family protein [Clostridia bacterium]